MNEEGKEDTGSADEEIQSAGLPILYLHLLEKASQACNEFERLVKNVSELKLEQLKKYNLLTQKLLTKMISNKPETLSTDQKDDHDDICRRLEQISDSFQNEIIAKSSDDIFKNYDPKVETPNTKKVARKLAIKIGIRSPSKKLKRKIYFAQLFGNKKLVNKIKPELENYIRVLENQQNAIDTTDKSQAIKDKLIGVFNAEIDYCQKLMREFDKDLSLSLRARRAAKLAFNHPKRIATNLFQSAIKKLENDSVDLCNKLYGANNIQAKPSDTMNGDQILALVKSNMENLKAQDPDLYKNYLLALFYKYRVENMHSYLKPEQQELLDQLPKLSAEIIDKLNLRGMNVPSGTIEYAKSLHVVMFEPEDLEQLLQTVGDIKISVLKGLGSLVDPVFNILDHIDSKKVDVSLKYPIDIICDTSTDQDAKTAEFSQFIQSSLGAKEEEIKRLLKEYTGYQEQLKNANPVQKRLIKNKMNKVEKSVMSLLEIRPLNDILKSQMLLNIALNDKDKRLQKLNDHSAGFFITISTALHKISFGNDESSTALIRGMLTREAERAKKISLAQQKISLPGAGARIFKSWASKKVSTVVERRTPPPRVGR